MQGSKVLWLTAILVAAVALGAVWWATQWTAVALGHQPGLGPPWFILSGHPIYPPPAFFWWWFVYDAYAPKVFLRGALIAASGGILCVALAMALSVWRGREVHGATTFGTARWANDQEIRAAGLLNDEGVVLGRFRKDYRWSTRALMLDKTDAIRLLSKIRRQWFAKRKSIGAILKEVMTNEAASLIDSDAANKAADADAALQDLGADDVAQAFVTASIVVWDEDPRAAAEKLRLVEKTIQGRDFTVIPETLNAVEAWLGTQPGHVYANVRQPPISTLNLAHMMPLSAVWAGPSRDEHLRAPPLFHARTAGSTPFRFSLHVGDVGHCLVVGPTGAGKSVLLAMMALSFRRYAHAQIFAFDFGGSIRAATLAMGGTFHDLGGGQAPSLQPLARIDDLAERTWAAEWLSALLAREGAPLAPEGRERLWSALGALATAPVDQRTISGLIALLQDAALKLALKPYAVGGSAGRLLDAEHETLAPASIEAFETEGLVGAPGAGAVLAYLFHRIEGRLDGRPTLVIVDEGWLALDDPQFAGQLREWLKTLRKKNASVVFATQSLADIKDSPIAPAIIESWGLFGKTAFLAERVLGNVVASGVKVMVLAVVVGMLTNLSGKFSRITLYANNRDIPLKASKKKAGGVPRAGQLMADGMPIIVAGVDSIDATRANMDWSGLNHNAYVFDDRLRADLQGVVAGKGPPEARTNYLRKIVEAGKVFWRLQ